MSKVFIPHKECWCSNGACFEEGRCLHSCIPKLPAWQANGELAAAIRLLQELSSYTRLWRNTTGYVDGSSIDLTIKEAQDLISRHRGG